MPRSLRPAHENFPGWMTGAAWAFLLVIVMRWLLHLRVAGIGRLLDGILRDLAHPPAPGRLRLLPLIFAFACIGLLLRSRPAAQVAAWLAFLIGLTGLAVAARSWVAGGRIVPWVALVYLGFAVGVHRRLRTRLFVPGLERS